MYKTKTTARGPPLFKRCNTGQRDHLVLRLLFWNSPPGVRFFGWGVDTPVDWDERLDLQPEDKDIGEMCSVRQRIIRSARFSKKHQTWDIRTNSDDSNRVIQTHSELDNCRHRTESLKGESLKRCQVLVIAYRSLPGPSSHFISLGVISDLHKLLFS